MRKFAGYPIVINYNLHTQLRSRPKELALHQAAKYEAERQLTIKTNTSSDGAIENNLWKKEIDQYEGTVHQMLQKVEANPVGRTVLGLINKQATVWIIPKSDADLKQCNCAQTNPLKFDIPKDGSYARGFGSGDTVIQFRPELEDDTLLHELVHAYRYSYNKYRPIVMDVWDGDTGDIQNSEEFFAHQMETIYLSQANRPLELDYKWARVSDKATIYDFLVKNTKMLQALKGFLRHEYMAMIAAHTFSAVYNPFRDFKSLEAANLMNRSANELPELSPLAGS